MNADAPPSLLVRDLMSVGVPSCGLQTPVSELARAMVTEKERNVEAFVVLDENGHAVGFVGQEDLVAAYGQDEAGELPAEAVMRPEVPEVPPDIPLAAAAQIMRDYGVRVLYITHHARGIRYPAAFLTYTHLLRHLAAEDEAELRDLGIKAEREAPLETFLRRRDEARKRAQSRRR